MVSCIVIHFVKPSLTQMNRSRDNMEFSWSMHDTVPQVKQLPGCAVFHL